MPGRRSVEETEASTELDERDRLGLLRWQRWMVSTFVGMWAYVLVVIAAYVLLEPPSWILQLALLPALVLVVAGGVLQFSVRCPSCGYRLGRQSSLLVPERCRSCGVPLRPSNGDS